MKIKGEITPSKIFAVLIIAVGFLAVFKDMEAVAHVSIIASAGLYGWRKHEVRKMKEADNASK